jgi:hypothetical protein
MWLTLESKTPSLFAPPHLYGSYLSTSNTVTGVSQLIVQFALTPAGGIGLMMYLVPTLSLLCVSIASLVLFSIVIVCISGNNHINK